MVFDGDTPESPRQEKRHQGHDPNDRVENQKMNRQSSEDPRHRDQENKHLRDRDRHSVRSRGYREESRRDSQASRSGGRRSYQDYREEGRDAEKPKLRQRDTDDKLDQRESGKRYTDDGNYAERRHDGEYRKGVQIEIERSTRRDEETEMIGLTSGRVGRDVQSMISLQRGMIENIGRNMLMMTDETREMSQFTREEVQGRKIENIEGERHGSDEVCDCIILTPELLLDFGFLHQ